MSLSKNKLYDRTQNGTIYDLPVASGVKLYQGAFVCMSATGYANEAAATSGFRAVGIAYYQADNTSGDNAAINVSVERGATIYYPNTNAAVTDINLAVYATADDTLTTTSGASGKFGEIVKVATSAGWYVKMVD